MTAYDSRRRSWRYILMLVLPSELSVFSIIDNLAVMFC